jgi:hypothetical protein
MNNIKSQIIEFLSAIPLLGKYLDKFICWYRTRNFDSSANYWENRYKVGGDSGSGSYKQLAHFKADYLNMFVAENSVTSLVEFGCGDGNQLLLADYPNYHGYDVSDTIIDKCCALFASEESYAFSHINSYDGQKYDVALSLDVIYHLVEEQVFSDYMKRLFAAAGRFVIIYSSNDPALNEKFGGVHVRHRNFTDWIAVNAKSFKLKKKDINKFPFNPIDPENTSLADFYIFEKSKV